MLSSGKKRTTRNSTRGRDQNQRNNKKRSNKKQSLSDKFQIGLGRFVDNVVFPSSDDNRTHLETGNQIADSMPTSFQTNDIDNNVPKEVNINLSEGTMHSNASNVAQDGLNEETSVGTKTNNVSQGVMHSHAPDLASYNLTEENNAATSNNNNVASNISASKPTRPNITEKHREYVEAWRDNPPPNEPRPMRFMEFVWHYVRNQPVSEIHEYDEEDSFDRDMKKMVCVTFQELVRMFPVPQD